MNDGSHPIKSSAAANSADQSAEDEMARYGITHQTVDVYFWGKYRYSVLKDALAQAKRAEDSRKS
jgi:hypothetical protein